jgi:ATP-dependent HslUV protease ATP-binding subunit HslU
MEKLLDHVSFDAPEMAQKSLTIDAAYVDRMVSEIAKNEDLSRYIL